MLEEAGCSVEEEVSLARACSFRIGGPARLFTLARNERELAASLRSASEAGLPYFILGRGTNVLFADEGFFGLVVRLDGDFQSFAIDHERRAIKAGAAVSISTLAHKAADEGLAGLEFAAGIPGSLGGSVIMNAGAYGGQVSDVARKVRCFDPDSGRYFNLQGDELGFGYRESAFRRRNLVVVSCLLQLTRGDPEILRARIGEILARRRQNQPLSYPSAGSVFKNPSEAANGWSAGKLIEEIGAKGWRIGGAVVSEKHANFIVNAGGATADDVVALIQKIRERVLEKFGVWLVPEIRILDQDGRPRLPERPPS